MAQDVVAKLQSSCLQARLAWLQVYRSKSSRQLRVLANGPANMGTDAETAGHRFCEGAGAAASSGQCHGHTFIWAPEPTSGLRSEGSRQHKQVLVLPAVGS